MVPEFTVTSRAAGRIRAIVGAEPDGRHLRVTVSGGGCSGFQYVFALDGTRGDDDIAIEKDGATVVIDSLSLGYMQGSELDYVDDLIGASFRIKNPQATAACGCGTSFSI
ncbi:MAG: iron-sulfur cluster insertion protein ErpA [Pseudomonadota bacterium]|nr:iron-sulfur cluster insertion protein ErpA [Pseudomonadota bacterium]